MITILCCKKALTAHNGVALLGYSSGRVPEGSLFNVSSDCSSLQVRLQYMDLNTFETHIFSVRWCEYIALGQIVRISLKVILLG